MADLAPRPLDLALAGLAVVAPMSRVGVTAGEADLYHRHRWGRGEAETGELVQMILKR
jgi:hypothetical protein